MFKNFFKKKEKKDPNNKNILIIALLIHAAKIDENYSEKEKNMCGLDMFNIEKVLSRGKKDFILLY